MKRFFSRTFTTGFIATATLSGFAGAALAQSLEVCTAVFNSEVYETTDRSSELSLLNHLKDELCKEDISVFKANRITSRDGGGGGSVVDFFEVGFDEDVDRDFSETKSTESALCKMTASDFSKQLSEQQKTSSGKFALDAFKECVTSGLWLQYERSDRGNRVQLQLVRRIAGSNRIEGYTIEDVDVLSADGTRLICDQTLTDIIDGNPLEVSTTQQIFNCLRDGEGSVSITFRTSQSDYAVELPRFLEAAADRVECSMSDQMPGINFAGHNLQFLRGIPSADVCEQLCDGQDECQAWGYRSDSSLDDFQSCWIKSARSDPSPNSSVVSGYRDCN